MTQLDELNTRFATFVDLVPRTDFPSAQGDPNGYTLYTVVDGKSVYVYVLFAGPRNSRNSFLASADQVKEALDSFVRVVKQSDLPYDGEGGKSLHTFVGSRIVFVYVGFDNEEIPRKDEETE